MIVRMATETDNFVSFILAGIFGLFGLALLIGMIMAYINERRKIK